MKIKEYLVMPNELDADSFSVEASSKEEAYQQALTHLGWILVENEDIDIEDENQIQMNFN
jgi:hypothetical protein